MKQATSRQKKTAAWINELRGPMSEEVLEKLRKRNYSKLPLAKRIAAELLERKIRRLEGDLDESSIYETN